LVGKACGLAGGLRSERAGAHGPCRPQTKTDRCMQRSLAKIAARLLAAKDMLTKMLKCWLERVRAQSSSRHYFQRAKTFFENIASEFRGPVRSAICTSSQEITSTSSCLQRVTDESHLRNGPCFSFRACAARVFPWCSRCPRTLACTTFGCKLSCLLKVVKPTGCFVTQCSLATG